MEKLLKLMKIKNKSNMTHRTYTSNKSYRTHRTYLVLFVLLFFFFALPAKPAHAATLSRPPSNLGLVGYWPFNENTGTYASDQSGNGYGGSIVQVSGTPSWTAGKSGTALSFDGANNGYVENADIAPMTNFTLSAWVYNQSGGDSRHSILNSFWEIVGNDICFWSYGFANLYWRCSGGGVPYNAWTHVTTTWDGSIIRHYINGSLYWTDGSPSSGSSQVFTTIAGYTGRKFYGKLDDLRVYNRALTATEVSKLYSSGQTTLKKVSEQGLVGYWALNDGRGSYANDSSNNRYTGTLRNGPVWSSGKRGGGMTFDGLNDYVEIPSTESLKYRGGDITISAWIKPDPAEADGGFFISKPWTGCGEYNYRLIYNSNKTIDLSIMGSVYDGVSSGSAVAGKNVWSHIVATVDSSKNMKLYINGILVNSKVHTVSSWVAPGCGGDNNLPLSIGTLYPYGEGWAGVTGHAFKGSMDEVRIYNRVLSATEIQALYKQNETMANAPQNDKLTNGLVGLWSFNGKDVSGATAYDRSGKNRNATIVGATLDAGKVGQAINFSGASQYVVSGGAFSELGTSNQPYSFAGWVKVAPNETDGNIIHMASGSGGIGWCLPPVALVAGKLRGYSWNGGGVSVTGTTSLNSGEWYHFVNTWDATNGLRIYVNGVLENSTAMASYTASGASNYLWLSFDPGGCSGTNGDFDGAIDEVRIYNRSLSASEIKQLYNLGK